jgi:hypothetical protein
MDMESLELYLGLLIEAGCKVKGRTTLFDKDYVWMTSQGGSWFLERIPSNA